jgi:hypothetical protein
MPLEVGKRGGGRERGKIKDINHTFIGLINAHNNYAGYAGERGRREGVLPTGLQQLLYPLN